ncbi:MAG: DUF4347 domain-containing protein, partial [Thermincola sp.]|nr:DUF4347 domain-containing protein [Thermincola sp.]MDT3702378.1 DUF4347 domain-containing protein [Thermincola sp.]
MNSLIRWKEKSTVNAHIIVWKVLTVIMVLTIVLFNLCVLTVQASSDPQEIVFIENNLPDYQSLVAGVKPVMEVHVLDSSKDGLEKMAQILAGRSGIDAIHLLSHGAAGQINLGVTTLTNVNLNDHADLLAQMGAALAEEGDILIYGCNVAKGAGGQQFISDLASATGADVAASDNATGAAEKDGDWFLESAIGNINTSALGLNYSHVFTDQFTRVGDPFPDVQYDIRITFGDFDNDGDIDALSQSSNVVGQGYIFTRADGNGIYTNLNQSGTSIPNSPFANVDLTGLNGTGGFYVASVIPFDYDNDGDTDIISRSGSTTGGANFILRNDNGGFTRIVDPFPDLQYDQRIEFADFDNDGDFDALAQNGNTVGQGYIYVRCNADGTYTQFNQSGTSIPGTPFANTDLSGMSGLSYFAVDYDNDGDKDIINRSGSTTGGSNFILRNDNGTAFTKVADPFVDTQYDLRMIFGDFDSDGDIDALQQLSNVVGQGYFYMQRNSDGTYSRFDQSGTSIPNSPFSSVDFTGLNGMTFYSIDFDNDGDLDVISRSNSTSGGANFIFKSIGSPPILVSSTPADNSTGVAVDVNIVLNLSENITAGSGNIYIKKTSDNSIIETIAANSPKVNISGSSITINPDTNLQNNTSYYLAFDLYAFLDSDSKGFGYLNEFVRAGFDNINLLNFTTADLPSNNAPTFVGITTTLTVNENATATDVTSLLHVSDIDSSQTLTWSQSSPPSHGTLSFSGATAISGGTDITPGGTITYTPTSGYSGPDSFTVQVSDGNGGNDTCTITVNAPAPVDISAATVTMTAPVAGASPQDAAAVETATSDADYTVTGLTWNAALTAGNKFKAGLVYTATITLTSKNGKEFQAGAFTPAVAGSSSVGTTTTTGTGTGNTVSFTVTFDATEAQAEFDFEANTSPVSDDTGLTSSETVTQTKDGETIYISSTGGKFVIGDELAIIGSDFSAFSGNVMAFDTFYDDSTRVRVSLQSGYSFNLNTFGILDNYIYSHDPNSIMLVSSSGATYDIGAQINYGATDHGEAAMDVSGLNGFKNITYFDFYANGSNMQLALDNIYLTNITAPQSSDAGLTSVLGQTITAGSEAGTSGAPKTASISVANAVSTVAAGDIVKHDAGATVTFYGTDSTFTTPAGGSVSLTAGSGTDVYIKVVAADSTTLYYKVTINREAGASLAHDVTGNAKTFSALTAGYGAGAGENLTATVTSTGINNNITAVLSGADAASFTLTENINALTDGQSDTFTVVANNGLATGTYNATVTITSNEYPAGVTFTVQQTVNAAPINIISAAGVTGVVAPAAGATPITVGSLTAGHGTYTVTNLTWQNGDGTAATLTSGGKFKAGSTYKAVIELTAAAGNKFQAMTPEADAGTAGAGTINVDAEGNKLTFTVTFNATAAPQVTGISVTTQPSKMSYTEGETLDLSGLEATLTFNDGSTADVAFAQFGVNSITASPANGTAMSVATHNGNPVTLTCNGQQATTSNLSVNAPAPVYITVTFKDYDGTTLKTETVEHGSGATAPAAPDRTGYTFTDWDPAFNNVTDNLTVTAQYSVNQYTVSFDSNGGSAVDGITADYDSTITAPAAPTKEGYDFGGWYKEEGLENAWDFEADTIPADDITLYAKWIIKEYTVTFKDYDGTTLKTETVDHGSGATAPAAPVKTGYTFTGWDTAFNNVT